MGIPSSLLSIVVIYFFFPFNLTYSRWPSSLQSCLWSLRIFPSLPGSCLAIFLSRCKFSTLTTRQPMVDFRDYYRARGDYHRARRDYYRAYLYVNLETKVDGAGLHINERVWVRNTHNLTRGEAISEDRWREVE